MSISKFRIKQLLFISTSIIVYLVYVSIRMTKLCNVKKFKSLDRRRIIENYETYTPKYRAIADIIERFRDSEGSFYIKYCSNKSFMESARMLKSKYSIPHVVFLDKLVDVCHDEKYCKTVDIRHFIHSYFKEITVTNEEISIFQNVYYPGKVCKTWRLSRDDEGVLSKTASTLEAEEILKTLGFMLALALLSETYLEIHFLDNFIGQLDAWQFEELMIGELEHFDSSQKAVYDEIKRAGNNEYFIFEKNSKTPMRRLFYNGRYSGLSDHNEIFDERQAYTKDKYPFKDAAREILEYPYEVSRTFISQGIKQIFGDARICGFYSFCRDSKAEKIFNHINELNLNDWKNNSDYDRTTRLFWAALNRISTYEQMNVYSAITGFKGVPAEGFDRLPRTKLIAHMKPFWKIEPYTVYVPTNCTSAETLRLFNEFTGKIETLV